MIVTLTIVFIILISLVIPLKCLKLYYIMSAFCLSSLYLFVEPIESDLSRLYGVVAAIKNVPITDIILMKNGSYDNYFLNLYIPHYPVFCLYAKMASTFPKQFLVFFPALVLYLIPVKICFSGIYNQTKRWLYVLSYSAFLMMTDFLSISAIRNISVAMLFSFILYYDLNEKMKKYQCFVAYIFLCLIHSYAVLLMMIRLLIMLSNKYTRIILIFCLGIGHTILISGNNTINLLFGNVGILSYALKRLNHYTDYVGTEVLLRRFAMLLIYLAILTISVLAHNYLRKHKKDTLFRTKIYDYLLFSTIFALGAFAQYDVFIRGSFVIFPVWILYFREYMNVIGGQRFGSIIYTNNSFLNEVVIYFGTIITVILIFLYLAKTGYDWMDLWFLK